MNSKKLACIVALTLWAVVMPFSLAAQNNVKQNRSHRYHHYQIVDPGTFGGPQNWLFNPDWAPFGFLTNQGTLAGAADTSAVDPYCFWSPADCYATSGLQWREGVTANLGVLPGGIGSQVNWISANGLMAGVADNGQQDPLNPSIPQIHGVLWDHGKMTDLGTLPAGGYDMWANVVNNSGEVAGQAYNTIPDANSFFGYGYQSRAVYWKNGVMQDLGTLGTGTDADAILINERGQVVGVSYVNSTPSAFCSGVQLGFVFTTGSFIWDAKNGMRDLGGFGGTCTVAYGLNNRGQVVGQSNHADDLAQHPFVWDSSDGMIELPTGSGIYGTAGAINDAGKIVGEADAPDGQPSAMLWEKRGRKWQATYLGSLNTGDCATGASVNASRQVVGYSGPNGCVTVLPFLWVDGGPMVDLNTLVSSTSGLRLYEADQINDRGEILAQGLDASLNNHAVLLIPCDENHPDVTGCDYSTVDATAAAQSATPRSIPNSAQRFVHPWRSKRFHSSAVGGAATLTSPVSPVPDVTRPPQFWVAATPLTPSPVNPGGSATSSVTAGLGNGVATVTLTCSVQPSPPLAPTCSISPASYTFSGTPSTLTVSTFGPSGRLLSHPGSGVLYALWLPIFGLVVTGVSVGTNSNGQKRKLKTALLACALFPGLAFQLACGGKSSGGTPAGTYSVTITATGFIPVASTSSLTTLTVQ
jgi:probable HAF family extracellular repeat protein